MSFDFPDEEQHRQAKRLLREAQRRTREEMAKLPRPLVNQDHDLYHAAEEKFQEAAARERRAQQRAERTKPHKSDCYVTTACVELQGKPDDCYELTLLRRFRDEFVAVADGGPSEIAYYYRTAPQVVAAINAHPDRTTLFAGVFESMIRPTIQLIESGNLSDAREHYKTCMLGLTSRFLPNNSPPSLEKHAQHPLRRFTWQMRQNIEMRLAD